MANRFSVIVEEDGTTEGKGKLLIPAENSGNETVYISGADTSVPAVAGGQVQIESGTGGAATVDTVAGGGGDIVIDAADGGASAFSGIFAGVGGAVNISAGASGAVSNGAIENAGGHVNITAGNGAVGGDIKLDAGDGDTAGIVEITAGSSTTSVSGNATLAAGSGFAGGDGRLFGGWSTEDTYPGGNVVVQGGEAGAANGSNPGGPGGYISVAGGGGGNGSATQDSGTGGPVYIRAGNAGFDGGGGIGLGGNVDVSPGLGSANGAILIGNSTDFVPSAVTIGTNSGTTTPTVNIYGDINLVGDAGLVATNPGKTIDITAGAGAPADGMGGAVNITAGAGVGLYDGGSIAINAGLAGEGAEAADYIGNGNITLQAGSPGTITNTPSTGGYMGLYAGRGGSMSNNSYDASTGGDVYLESGNGGQHSGTGRNGDGGDIYIQSGDGGLGASQKRGNGGDLTLGAGHGIGQGGIYNSSIDSGDGGLLSISAGDGASGIIGVAGRPGGSASLSAGHGGTGGTGAVNGNGGQLDLFAGDSGTLSSQAGTGGAVLIKAGQGATTSGTNGAVTIQTGRRAGATAADITLDASTGSAGGNGNIILTPKTKTTSTKVIESSGGLGVVTTTTKDTAASGNRGLIWVDRGGTAVPDKAYLSIKNNIEGYEWIEIGREVVYARSALSNNVSRVARNSDQWHAFGNASDSVSDIRNMTIYAGNDDDTVKGFTSGGTGVTSVETNAAHGLGAGDIVTLVPTGAATYAGVFAIGYIDSTHFSIPVTFDTNEGGYYWQCTTNCYIPGDIRPGIYRIVLNVSLEQTSGSTQAFNLALYEDGTQKIIHAFDLATGVNTSINFEYMLNVTNIHRYGFVWNPVGNATNLTSTYGIISVSRL